MSQLNASQPAATQPVEPKRSSPIRLIVLLGILGIVLAAFLVDMFVMYDSVNAAVLRLQAAADETAARSVEKTDEQQLTHEGVVKAIGFEPANSVVENGQLRESYRWWGSLPLKRRFIEVIYEDEEGQRFNSYEVSNRDLFGKDVDPDAMTDEQPSPQAPDGASPDPPMPEVGPMPPSKTDGDLSETSPGAESATDKEVSPSPPADDAVKDADSTDK